MRSLSDILAHSRTIAVVGLSPNPDRASLGVASYLQQHGYRIIPVNPVYAGQQILGETVVASLQEAAAALGSDERIDIVDGFRRAEEMPELARAAIAVHARCLWMQLGIANAEAADLAAAAGLDVVQDTCIKVAHAMQGPR
jgi:predicted CoA-binding protein